MERLVSAHLPNRSPRIPHQTHQTHQTHQSFIAGRKALIRGSLGLGTPFVGP